MRAAELLGYCRGHNKTRFSRRSFFLLTKIFSLDEDFLTQKTILCLCGVNFWCGVLCGAYFLSVIIFVKRENLRQENKSPSRKK